MMLLGLVAFAAPPADLDGLVTLAMERDPEAAALGWEVAAARYEIEAVRAPMDPQLMLGVEALGAPADALDPTMAMVGVTQMFRAPGERSALAGRAGVHAERAEAEQQRVRADLRTALWQASARIWIAHQELALVDEQLRSVTAMRESALSRYAAGSPAAGEMLSMPSMPQASADAMDMGTAPPLVAPRRSEMGGMPGGVEGMDGAEPRRAVLVRAVEPMPPSPMPMAPMPSASGLGGVLELDARISRVAAERAAIAAGRDGELAVLAVWVGDEAAALVAADPTAYLGAPPLPPPELRLAELDRAAAEADLRVARSARRPDFMVGVAERVMPEGRLGGTDLTVGVSVPLWSLTSVDAARARVSAAEERVMAVDRDLELAAARGRAALAAAVARATALEQESLPRAETAWKASLASFAAGSVPPADALRTWESWIGVGREALQARRDVLLLTAALARVEEAR